MCPAMVVGSLKYRLKSGIVVLSKVEKHYETALE